MNLQKLEFSRGREEREREREDDEAGVMDEFAKLDFSTRGKRGERG
jgi:flagellar biosynthesis chaperone FliJ